MVKLRVTTGALRACAASWDLDHNLCFLSNTRSRLVNVPGTLASQHIRVTPRGQDVEHVLTSLSEIFTWELYFTITIQNAQNTRESSLSFQNENRSENCSTGASGNSASLNSYTPQIQILQITTLIQTWSAFSFHLVEWPNSWGTRKTTA